MRQSGFAKWGARVRQARGTRSQTWLARRCGVNQSTVSGWETGEIPIADDRKVAIADAFGLWVGELFPWSDIVRTPRGAVVIPDRSPVQVEAPERRPVQVQR